MGSEEQIDFSVEIAGNGVVGVRGDIDLASAPRFEAALRHAVHEHGGDLTIDFTDVGFMDSSGMNVLVRIYKAIDGDGRSLNLVHLSSPVRRALEVGGVAGFATLG